MSDIIETLLLRNLQEVFGEGDPTRRRAAIEELYTEDCMVLLPIGRYVGHRHSTRSPASCAPVIRASSTRRTSPPQAVQDGGRLAWGSGPAGEPPRYTGLDVIVVRDGKIAALYVFLELAARMKWRTPRLIEIWSSAIAEGRQTPGRHVTLRYCVDSLRSVRLSLVHAIGAVMPEAQVAEPCALLGQSATAAVTEDLPLNRFALSPPRTSSEPRLSGSASTGPSRYPPMNCSNKRLTVSGCSC